MHDCLYNDDEWDGDMGSMPPDLVRADGVVTTYGFHPGRLWSHVDEILEMLSELPDDFMRDRGGGMSFLNACVDRHGNQWTSLHRTMEALFCLGIATGRVECLLPRDMWHMMPGGMPYYVVDGRQHDER